MQSAAVWLKIVRFVNENGKGAKIKLTLWKINADEG